MMSAGRKTVASALVYSILHSITFAPLAQAGLWEERRASGAAGPRTSDSILLAQLPTIQTLVSVPAAPAGADLAVLASGVSDSRRGALQRRLRDLPLGRVSLRRVAVPPSWKPDDPIVVHIQDVHLNREAQDNIDSSVRQLIEGGNVGLVALEGAFGPLDFSRFRSFRDRDGVRRAADYLLKEDKISGAVHAALCDEKSIPDFVGIDDREHYDAHVGAYRRSRELAADQKSALAAQIVAIEKEKARTFNAGLLEFDARVGDFRSENVRLGPYARYLASRGGNITDEVRKFLKAFEAESSLDFAAVESERARVVRQLVKRMGPGEVQGMLNATVSYRTGRFGNGEFYSYLKKLCARNGIDFAEYPNMRAYVQYALIADGIRSEKLLADIGKMEAAGYASLARTAEEKRLVARARQAYLTGKLLDFSLSPAEWKEYAASGSENQIAPLSGLPIFEGFFQEAVERDRLMAENFMRAMEKRKNAVALLVAGGFHSAGLEEKLAGQNFAVVTLAPKLSKVEGKDGAAYLNVFAREKTPLEKLFRSEKLFVPPEVFGHSARMTGAILASLAAGALADAGGEARSVEAASVREDFAFLAGPEGAGYAVQEAGVEGGIPFAQIAGPDGIERVGLVLDEEKNIGEVRSLPLRAGARAIRLLGEARDSFENAPRPVRYAILLAVGLPLAFFSQGTMTLPLAAGTTRSPRDIRIGDLTVHNAVNMPATFSIGETFAHLFHNRARIGDKDQFHPAEDWLDWVEERTFKVVPFGRFNILVQLGLLERVNRNPATYAASDRLRNMTAAQAQEILEIPEMGRSNIAAGRIDIVARRIDEILSGEASGAWHVGNPAALLARTLADASERLLQRFTRGLSPALVPVIEESLAASRQAARGRTAFLTRLFETGLSHDQIMDAHFNWAAQSSARFSQEHQDRLIQSLQRIYPLPSTAKVTVISRSENSMSVKVARRSYSPLTITFSLSNRPLMSSDPDNHILAQHRPVDPRLMGIQYLVYLQKDLFELGDLAFDLVIKHEMEEMRIRKRNPDVSARSAHQIALDVVDSDARENAQMGAVQAVRQDLQRSQQKKKDVRKFNRSYPELARELAADFDDNFRALEMAMRNAGDYAADLARHFISVWRHTGNNVHPVKILFDLVELRRLDPSFPEDFVSHLDRLSRVIGDVGIWENWDQLLAIYRVLGKEEFKEFVEDRARPEWVQKYGRIWLKEHFLSIPYLLEPGSPRRIDVQLAPSSEPSSVMLFAFNQLRTVLQTNPEILDQTFVNIFDDVSLVGREIRSIQVQWLDRNISCDKFLVTGLVAVDKAGKETHYDREFVIVVGNLPSNEMLEAIEAMKALATYPDMILYPFLGGQWWYNGSFWVLTESHTSGKSLREELDAAVNGRTGDPAAVKNIVRSFVTAYLTAWKIWRDTSHHPGSRNSRFVTSPDYRHVVDGHLTDIFTVRDGMTRGEVGNLLMPVSPEFGLSLTEHARIIVEVAVNVLGEKDAWPFLIASANSHIHQALERYETARGLPRPPNSVGYWLMRAWGAAERKARIAGGLELLLEIPALVATSLFLPLPAAVSLLAGFTGLHLLLERMAEGRHGRAPPTVRQMLTQASALFLYVGLAFQNHFTESGLESILFIFGAAGAHLFYDWKTVFSRGAASLGSAADLSLREILEDPGAPEPNVAAELRLQKFLPTLAEELGDYWVQSNRQKLIDTYRDIGEDRFRDLVENDLRAPWVQELGISWMRRHFLEIPGMLSTEPRHDIDIRRSEKFNDGIYQDAFIRLKAAFSAHPEIIIESIRALYKDASFEYGPADIAGFEVQPVGFGTFNKVFLLSGIKTRDGLDHPGLSVIVKITHSTMFPMPEEGEIIYFDRPYVNRFIEAGRELASLEPPLYSAIGGAWMFHGGFWLFTEGLEKGQDLESEKQDVLRQAANRQISREEAQARLKALSAKRIEVYLSAWKAWKDLKGESYATPGFFARDPYYQNVIGSKLIDINDFSERTSPYKVIKSLHNDLEPGWISVPEVDRIIVETALRLMGEEKGREFLLSAQDDAITQALAGHDSGALPSAPAPAIRLSGRELTDPQHEAVNQALSEFFKKAESGDRPQLLSMESDEYRDLDAMGALRANDVRIVVINGLNRRIVEIAKELEIDPPYDLLSHPGRARRSIYIDAKVLPALRRQSWFWRASWSIHELDHIQHRYDDEATVQARSPVPGITRKTSGGAWHAGSLARLAENALIAMKDWTRDILPGGIADSFREEIRAALQDIKRGEAGAAELLKDLLNALSHGDYMAILDIYSETVNVHFDESWRKRLEDGIKTVYPSAAVENLQSDSVKTGILIRRPGEKDLRLIFYVTDNNILVADPLNHVLAQNKRSRSAGYGEYDFSVRLQEALFGLSDAAMAIVLKHEIEEITLLHRNADMDPEEAHRKALESVGGAGAVRAVQTAMAAVQEETDQAAARFPVLFELLPRSSIQAHWAEFKPVLDRAGESAGELFEIALSITKNGGNISVFTLLNDLAALHLIDPAAPRKFSEIFPQLNQRLGSSWIEDNWKELVETYKTVGPEKFDGALRSLQMAWVRDEGREWLEHHFFDIPFMLHRNSGSFDVGIEEDQESAAYRTEFQKLSGSVQLHPEMVTESIAGIFGAQALRFKPEEIRSLSFKHLGSGNFNEAFLLREIVLGDGRRITDRPVVFKISKGTRFQVAGESGRGETLFLTRSYVQKMNRAIRALAANKPALYPPVGGQWIFMGPYWIMTEGYKPGPSLADSLHPHKLAIQYSRDPSQEDIVEAVAHMRMMFEIYFSVWKAWREAAGNPESLNGMFTGDADPGNIKQQTLIDANYLFDQATPDRVIHTLRNELSKTIYFLPRETVDQALAAAALKVMGEDLGRRFLQETGDQRLIGILASADQSLSNGLPDAGAQPNSIGYQIAKVSGLGERAARIVGLGGLTVEIPMLLVLGTVLSLPVMAGFLALFAAAHFVLERISASNESRAPPTLRQLILQAIVFIPYIGLPLQNHFSEPGLATLLGIFSAAGAHLLYDWNSIFRKEHPSSRALDADDGAPYHILWEDGSHADPAAPQRSLIFKSEEDAARLVPLPTSRNVWIVVQSGRRDPNHVQVTAYLRWDNESQRDFRKRLNTPRETSLFDVRLSVNPAEPDTVHLGHGGPTPLLKNLYAPEKFSAEAWFRTALFPWLSERGFARVTVEPLVGGNTLRAVGFAPHAGGLLIKDLLTDAPSDLTPELRQKLGEPWLEANGRKLAELGRKIGPARFAALQERALRDLNDPSRGALWVRTFLIDIPRMLSLAPRRPIEVLSADGPPGSAYRSAFFNLGQAIRAHPKIVVDALRNVHGDALGDLKEGDIEGVSFRILDSGHFNRVFLMESVTTADGRILRDFPVVFKVTRGIFFDFKEGDIAFTSEFVANITDAAIRLHEASPSLYPRSGGQWLFERPFWIMAEEYVPGPTLQEEFDQAKKAGDDAAVREVALRLLGTYLTAWKTWRGEFFVQDASLENVKGGRLIDLNFPLDRPATPARVSGMLTLAAAKMGFDLQEASRMVVDAAFEVFGPHAGRQFVADSNNRNLDAALEERENLGAWISWASGPPSVSVPPRTLLLGSDADARRVLPLPGWDTWIVARHYQDRVYLQMYSRYPGETLDDFRRNLNRGPERQLFSLGLGVEADRPSTVWLTPGYHSEELKKSGYNFIHWFERQLEPWLRDRGFEEIRLNDQSGSGTLFLQMGFESVNRIEMKKDLNKSAARGRAPTWKSSAASSIFFWIARAMGFQDASRKIGWAGLAIEIPALLAAGALLPLPVFTAMLSSFAGAHFLIQNFVARRDGLARPTFRQMMTQTAFFLPYLFLPFIPMDSLNDPRAMLAGAAALPHLIYDALQLRRSAPETWARVRRTGQPEAEREAARQIANAMELLAADPAAEFDSVGLARSINGLLEDMPLPLEVENIGGLTMRRNGVLNAIDRADPERFGAELKKALGERLSPRLNPAEARRAATQAIYHGFAAGALRESLAQPGNAAERSLTGAVIDPSIKDPAAAAARIMADYQRARGENRVPFVFFHARGELSAADIREIERAAGKLNVAVEFVESDIFDHAADGSAVAAGLNFAALDAALTRWVGDRARFSSYRLVIPKSLMGDLSGFENLPADALLRRAAIVIIDRALKALPALRADDLDRIHRAASIIARQA